MKFTRLVACFAWFALAVASTYAASASAESAKTAAKSAAGSSAKITRPPSPAPDRIILTWTGDPATSQAVTWRTDATVTAACAELQPATDGPLPIPTNRVAAQTQPLTPIEGTAALSHTVEFTGLTPGTQYSYRVGDGTRWSEWFQFRTAQPTAAPFTFLFLGDPQYELRDQWSRVWRQAWLAAPHAAFAVLTGDLINRGDRDAEWGEWFEAVGWVGATRPLVLAVGSHEYYAPPSASASTTTAADSTAKKSSTTTPRALTPNWRAQFAFPPRGPAGLEEQCYTFDYQGARFVVLNAQEKREEQAVWLRQVLTAPRPRWTILAFHEPIFSGGRGRDNKRLREAWKPAFDELQVDLVLTGHDHVYARSGLTGVPTGYPSPREVANGTVYVVAVSGPKMYDLTSTDWARRSAAQTQTYQVVTIDGDTLKYRADTATGRRFDAFTLRKRPGAPNEIIEEAVPAATAASQ